VKYKEFTEQSKGQLFETLADLKKKLFMLGFQSKADMLQNKSLIRKCRRDIARVQTRLTDLRG
jgi:ribosomal protein L29